LAGRPTHPGVQRGPRIRDGYPSGSYLPEEAAAGALSRDAVKVNDANAHLWDERIWSRGIHCPLTMKNYQAQAGGKCLLYAIRTYMLRVWRKLVLGSLLQYLKNKYGTNWWGMESAANDIDVGWDCMRHVGLADWGEWTKWLIFVVLEMARRSSSFG